MNIQIFKKMIWIYFKKNKRDLPWRKTRDPYKILVSEIMLQQTQSYRVESKYKSFLKKFPTAEALAKAKLHNVLQEWQGLGYNRRALYLKKCTEIIVKDYNGKFPKDLNTLISLPGIGRATAGDIMAFAWNIPSVFIETNIRSVFIHFFFNDKEQVSDKDILPLVEATLDKKNPRQWYWALFDYGVLLKKTVNPNRKSVHYAKQSKFIGSFRQKRALVLRTLLEKPRTKKEIEKILHYDSITASRILSGLEKEGFVKSVKSTFQISR
ncbi:MAG: A/G-specific adenine glycosylase [Candidatus Magasanikbacteria bacterium]|nr:A/G-specific adenine glycosylase [Candidatus Magasanikbacteria bacterium]